MNKLNFFMFFKNVIFSPHTLNRKWNNRKFRFMYILRSAFHPLVTVRYYNDLCALESVSEILTLQPALPAKIHRPYLHKGGKVSSRAQNIIEHYRFIERLPVKLKFIFLPGENILLTAFRGKDDKRFYVYISASGFDREGELMLSLCLENTPVARLSFSFIRTHAGSTAFIGGLQGAPNGMGQELIRCATKACHGLFPKRVIYEVFCLLARTCGIYDFLAVSENHHVFRQLRYRYQKRKTFVALYGDFWESVGGELNHGVYRLNTHTERKQLSDIASKKRSEYRRRYALLDSIESDMILSLK
ncbi:VirK/YbjX family protein [Citrobacter braakii]|uniref:VirK/YbjX family protein n=1 Tax=Citrobacter braakii TaxID=57706 RepID=UPI002B243730|nr:VirK/YbjX family protein [Citrobacter braakii]MEB2307295.1 VirK/YbjX family protein [Citrobacter braakii]